MRLFVAMCVGDPRRMLGREVWKDAPLSRIVAVGLLTQADLDMLGSGFTRAFPIDPAPCFEDLLAAIDRADRDAKAMAGEPEEYDPRDR